MQIGATVNGDRIYQARLKAGMSRVQLANAIKTSERNIQRWESGQNQPRVSSVARIAQATGHDLEFFLTDGESDDDEEVASMALTRDEKALRLSQILIDLLEEA